MQPHQDNILTKIYLFVKKHFFIIIIEFLVIILSFAIGFIKGGRIIQRPPLQICKEVLIDTNFEINSNNETSHNKIYVASNKGKYYYPLDCSLAQNLSEKNKIYFNSKEEAEAKGYLQNPKCEY